MSDSIKIDLDCNLEIIFNFQKPEYASFDCPGDPAYIELVGIKMFGYELSEEISEIILEANEEEFKEAIIDQFYENERGYDY